MPSDQLAVSGTTELWQPAEARQAVRTGPEFCIVIPVLNEHGNIAVLVERLRATLAGIDWEAVFVDDGSTDGTRDVIASIGRADDRIRLLHRIGRRGLASAFVEGALCSLAPFIAAMDGDLQHDETLLPIMLSVLKSNEADIVIGSRYVAGGALGEWSRRRAGLSSYATRISRIVLRADVSDPMSGFFALPRGVLDSAAPRLSAIGFKILLDVLASVPAPLRVRELPYTFRVRVAGTSKLDVGVLFDFALLLLDKLFGPAIPVRFIMFATIGALGLIAHLFVLRLGLTIGGLAFNDAQTLATVCAILGNFALNNAFTFRDRKLKGLRMVRGALIFFAACAIGAEANLNFANLMVNAGHQTWYFAGIVGAAMSLVWNYAVASTLTWRRRPA